MKAIFYRDINSGKLFNFHRMPETMTEKEVENAIHAMNNAPDKKSRVELIEIDEYGEFLLKKSEEKQLFSSECIQEALNALDNAMDCIRCLKVDEG